MDKKYEYDVFFDIVEKGKSKVLVDNYGYVCGIYKTYKDAKQAMKPIRKNIVREYRRRKDLGLFIPDPVKVSNG